MGLFDSETEDEKRERETRGGFQEVAAFEEGTMQRAVDEEAGVVLYVAKRQQTGHGYGLGLTSVPISETDLDVPEK